MKGGINITILPPKNCVEGALDNPPRVFGNALSRINLESKFLVSFVMCFVNLISDLPSFFSLFSQQKVRVQKFYRLVVLLKFG